MVRTGLDRLIADKRLHSRLQRRRVALVVNQATVTSQLRHITQVLPEIGVDVVRLYAPEHGLWGHAQDMEAVGHSQDPVTGWSIRSLYGDSLDSLAPPPQELSDLDVLLIDLPDIGTRYYTFAATAVYVARAAALAGVEVWILDRPNPLCGTITEGNRVDPGFESFVSALSVQNRHALTLGELVRFAAANDGPSFQVNVVTCEGWHRDQWFDQTGLPWVFPSPNMPSLETAIIYPGMCLLEATNLSEGRGTSCPFALFGAPFIDPNLLVTALIDLELEGVVLRPLVFQPAFQKWSNTPCAGAFIHVVDRHRLDSYRLGLAILWVARRLFPADFAWRSDPYEFIDQVPALDLLCGNADVRHAIEAGADFEEVYQTAVTIDAATEYRDQVREIRLYPEAE